MSWELAGRKCTSRLLIGTGKLATYTLIPGMMAQSGVEVLTVAVRRMNPSSAVENILQHIPPDAVIMVNTSGARNSKEAVKIALAGREITGSNWIKVEIETDSKYLLPDNEATIQASAALVREGCAVFAYISPDLVTARKLEQVGVAAVMPLAALIGTNKGITCETLLRPIIEEIGVPVIIDAGIGRPSHAAHAMELGADAVLISTAIAVARDPIAMTVAMARAVEAGRLAYEQGLPVEHDRARASSPLTGFLKSMPHDQ
ncbi:MAG: thiazole synthase [Planctomycetota bacterium]